MEYTVAKFSSIEKIILLNKNKTSPEQFLNEKSIFNIFDFMSQKIGFFHINSTIDFIDNNYAIKGEIHFIKGFNPKKEFYLIPDISFIIDSKYLHYNLYSFFYIEEKNFLNDSNLQIFKISII